MLAFSGTINSPQITIVIGRLSTNSTITDGVLFIGTCGFPFRAGRFDPVFEPDPSDSLSK